MNHRATLICVNKDSQMTGGTGEPIITIAVHDRNLFII